LPKELQAATYDRRWKIFALIFAAAVYSLTVTYPFNNDNALYAYMADLLLHGHLPYLGSWDQNFPGILLVHLMPLLVGLRSQLAFHVWDILLQLTGCWLIFQIVLKLSNGRAAFLAVVLSALYYVQQGLWMSGERDTYVTILLLAVLWLRMFRSRPMHDFLGGTVLGVIILFRPTYGLYLIAFAITLLIQLDNPAPLSDRVKRTLLLLVGGVIPALLIILIYAISGGLEQLWLSVIKFNFSIYSGTGEQFSLRDPIRFYFISVPAALAAVVVLWQAKQKPFLLLWSMIFVASVTSLIMLYRHSVYHYHPMMALFIVMSAIGWERATVWFAKLINTGTDAREGMRIALLTIIVLFFGYQTFRGNTIQRVVRDILSGKIHAVQEMYSAYEGSSQFGEPIQTAVGEYLKHHTEPGDNVQMFGPYSYPQYYARLGSASKFQTLHALCMRGKGDTLQPFQREWRKEYLRTLQTAPPVYFIVCDAPEAFRQYYGGMLGHEILNKDFVELRDWLRTSYHGETRIGAFTLYRKN
jgi:hypothetical protein